jgi:hypothetical protein
MSYPGREMLLSLLRSWPRAAAPIRSVTSLGVRQSFRGCNFPFWLPAPCLTSVCGYLQPLTTFDSSMLSNILCIVSSNLCSCIVLVIEVHQTLLSCLLEPAPHYKPHLFTSCPPSQWMYCCNCLWSRSSIMLRQSSYYRNNCSTPFVCQHRKVVKYIQFAHPTTRLYAMCL